jgi:hypothetical protein
VVEAVSDADWEDQMRVTWADRLRYEAAQEPLSDTVRESMLGAARFIDLSEKAADSAARLIEELDEKIAELEESS